VIILAARMLFRCASFPRVLVAPSLKIKTGMLASDKLLNSVVSMRPVIDKFVFYNSANAIYKRPRKRIVDAEGRCD